MPQPVACSAKRDQIRGLVPPAEMLRLDMMNLQKACVLTSRRLAAMSVAREDRPADRGRDGRAIPLTGLEDHRVAFQAGRVDDAELLFRGAIEGGVTAVSPRAGPGVVKLPRVVENIRRHRAQAGTVGLVGVRRGPGVF